MDDQDNSIGRYPVYCAYSIEYLAGTYRINSGQFVIAQKP